MMTEREGDKQTAGDGGDGDDYDLNFAVCAFAGVQVVTTPIPNVHQQMLVLTEWLLQLSSFIFLRLHHNGYLRSRVSPAVLLPQK